MKFVENVTAEIIKLSVTFVLASSQRLGRLTTRDQYASAIDDMLLDPEASDINKNAECTGIYMIHSRFSLPYSRRCLAAELSFAARLSSLGLSH